MSLKDGLKLMELIYMGFLTFLIVMGSSLHGISVMASDIKTASCKSELNKEQYSLDQFDTVLRLCRVKRYKYDGFKVLEERGYEKCLPYIRRQPLSTEEDVDAFIERYNDIRDIEIRQFLCYWEDIYYDTYEAEIKNKKCSRVITFENKHFLSSYDYVYNHAQDLYDNTFFGEIAVARPKIIRESNKIIEVWALHCSNTMDAKWYYEVCSKVLGQLKVDI